MQKHSEHSKHSSGFPLLICAFLGLLFFGTYLAVERLVTKALPSLGIALTFLLAYLFFAALTFLIFLLKERKIKGEQTLFESLNSKMHSSFKYTVDFPYAITDETGRIRTINNALQALLGAHDPFFRGTIADICSGTTLQDIIEGKQPNQEKHPSAHAEEGEKPAHGPANTAQVRLKNGGRYIARTHAITLNGQVNYLVTFTDVTELCNLREKMERDLPVIAYLDVDNLEDLAQYTRANYREVSRRVDDALIQWADKMNGFLQEYERDRYILFFSQEKLRLCENEKFASLLDAIRNIRLGEYGIPVTISMGISLMEDTLAERAKDAQAALEVALQRGGDQVTVRRKDGIKYYGGQTRTLPRRTRVQSRMVASFLLTKISESDNLLVMGHSNPDFDSIGSCIGIAQLGLLAGVPTKIIMDTANTNYRIATSRLLASPVYQDMFISGHEGLDMVRPGTLLVLTDANNLTIIEAPDVAESVRQISGKIAIIDHHRQTKEFDFEPIMTYIEPGASSACEMVTEMLEQSESGDGETSILVNDEVASVMLSGIMLDTGGFTRNTGSRTLDAARFLYGMGANAEYVHSFFNVDYEDYVSERTFSHNEFLHNHAVGLTWSEDAKDRVAAAKESDKLLGVKGVHAAFALITVDGAVHISARSDGSINVQLILERLGGGGRFDSAGAAMKDTSLEEGKARLIATIDEYFEEMEAARRAAAER